MDLANKTVLITGGARRVGRTLVLAAARAGANIILHHANSPAEAEDVAGIVRSMGQKVRVVQADLADQKSVEVFVDDVFSGPAVDVLINNAAIFEPADFFETDLALWQRHMDLNLTAPFRLSQAFARQNLSAIEKRIINILDWRALRPGSDHFAYTISKAGLAALTRSMAQVLAPGIIVNAIAFGAILPPSDGGDPLKVLENVPIKRWADLDEVARTMLFLLEGPAYITGEIIHLDGGHHLI